jgi:integrase
MEFVRWCDRYNLDWHLIDYGDDLLETWQTGLLTGTLSTSGKKLANGTVNVLISEAVYFLTWSADRKYRPPFTVTLNSVRVKRSSGRKSHSAGLTQIQSRMGSLPETPDFKMLPTNNEIKTWLHEVHNLRGPVKRLACETIIRTGLRIKECAELQLTDIPEKVNGSWQRGKVLSQGLAVRIHRGNKGRKVSAGSLESVKPRTIYLPLDLAERIYQYIEEMRTTLILRGIDKIKDKAERNKKKREKKSTHLWIGETYGHPLSTGMLYKSWKNVPSCPVDWHPHAGREYFAVETMVQYAMDLCTARDVFQVSGVNQLGWIDALMSNQIKVILSPQMGHVSEETTNIYLRKMKHRLVEIMGHPAILWADICGDEDF